MAITEPVEKIEVRYVYVTTPRDCRAEQKMFDEIENLKRQLACANREIMSLRRQRR